MKVSVILPAAGLGTRMGRTPPEKAGTSRKQFMLLDGQPILVHTVRKFAASPLVTEIVIALRAEANEHETTIKTLVKAWRPDLLDQQGVGKLVALGTELGRRTKPGLKVGICGEHGGEPSSVAFCERIGLDYVSCSPFRVPIARLAAAQAVIAAVPEGRRDRP